MTNGGGSVPSTGAPLQQQPGSAASRLQLQRQRLAEQRNRLLAGQGGSGAGDAKAGPAGQALPPRPVSREPTAGAPPPPFSTAAVGGSARPSTSLPSPPLVTALSPGPTGAIARAASGPAPPAPSSSQLGPPGPSLAVGGLGVPASPPVPPPARPQTQRPGLPYGPPAGGRPAVPPTWRPGTSGLLSPGAVSRTDALRGSHSLPPLQVTEAERSAEPPAERPSSGLLAATQSLPYAAAPAFPAAGVDDDSSFFSDYGEGLEQQQPQQEAGQEAGSSGQQADAAPSSSGERLLQAPPGEPAMSAGGMQEAAQGAGEGEGGAPAAGGEDGLSVWQSDLGYNELVQASYQASVQESYDSAAAWHVEAVDPASSASPLPTYTTALSQEEEAAAAAYPNSWGVAAGEAGVHSNGSAWAGHYPSAAAWTGAAAGYGYGSAADQSQYGAYDVADYGQAGYGALPSQEQTGYLAGGYDMRSQAAQSWQATPQTPEEAMRLPHGRPPIALLSFNIGGRLAVILPQTSAYGPGGAGVTRNGPIQLTRLAALPRLLRQDMPDAPLLPEGTRDRSGGLLRDFPGPLLPSSNRAKVAGFIRERELKVSEEEEGARSPDMVAALWGLLRLMALNEGRLRSPASPASKAKPSPPLEAQVAEVLGVADPTCNAVSSPPEPWLGEAAATGLPSAAAAVQALLLQAKPDQAVKAATAAGLWGPALVMAYQQGPTVFADTAAAMLARCLAEGSPLRTALSVMAGAGDRLFPAPGSGGLEASYNPGFGGGEGGLGHWRSQLTVLAANPSPGDEPVLMRLGDRLWSEAGEGAAAHVCYLLAGLRPEAYSGEARMCAVGWDHRLCRRGWTNPACLLRTQVLEWALPSQPGGAALSPAGLACLPYKVLYAVQLAEHGYVERAMQYCRVVLDSIAALGRPPPGLLVCRAAALDIQDRLQQHALGHNIRVNQVAGGTLMSSVGRWIDKGINKLIGGDLVPPPSTGSEPDSHSPAPPPRPQAGSRGASTGQRSPGQVRLQPGSGAGGNSSDGSLAAEPGYGVASSDTGGTGERSIGRGSSISLSGMLGRVGGLLTSIPSSAPKKESQIGEANTFYYDEETKQWRERGVEPPPLPEAPAPPLTSFQPPPSPPPSGAPMHGPLKRTGTHSRYVDTMASPQGQQTVLPEGGFGLRAASLQFGRKESDVSAPSFFVPADSHAQQGATAPGQSQPARWNPGY